MSVTYTRWVHHGEVVNVNVIDYVEAADHHLDLPDGGRGGGGGGGGASEFDQH